MTKLPKCFPAETFQTSMDEKKKGVAEGWIALKDFLKSHATVLRQKNKNFPHCKSVYLHN